MADIGARSVVQSELTNRLEDGVRGGGPAQVRIRSFPFLGRLLLSGRVSQVRASVVDLTAGDITFARVGVVVNGAKIDRSRLIADRRVVLDDVARVTATAVIDQAELRRLLGVTVTIEEGKASVTVGGRRVTAEVRVADGVLRARVAGINVPSVTIPKLPLLPCVSDVELVPGEIRLSCTTDAVPPELLGRASVDF